MTSELIAIKLSKNFKTKKENFMSKITILCLALLMAVGFTGSAFAKQCIKNESGAVLNVTWHNSEGKKDKNASNHSLSVGFKACQNNKNLGWAEIKCSGCIFAEIAAKAAITVAGSVAFGVCTAATGGGCAMASPVFEVATQAAIMSIPPAYKGKMIVVPNKGKTAVVKGNAFGLKVN